MPRETSTKYYSGQGIVYLAEKDITGILLGYRDIGNVAELKLAFQTDVVEHKESRTGNRLIDMRLATGKTATASMTLDGFDPETLKTAMYATSVTSIAGSATAESITARVGKVIPLSRIKVSTVVVKGTGAQSAITYVLDKNYTYNAAAGSIYLFSTAEQTAAAAVNVIADAAVLAVDYAYAAQSLTKAFKDSQKTYALRLEGLNTADSNNPVVISIPNFRPDPLKDLSLLTNDLQTFQMEGAALADTATGDFVNIQML
jgi:hypothetical protein